MRNVQVDDGVDLSVAMWGHLCGELGSCYVLRTMWNDVVGVLFGGVAFECMRVRLCRFGLKL